MNVLGVDRSVWRKVAANASTHYFHPQTGLHAQLTSPQTLANQPLAPRTVMFGITNVCNLSCDFCSRDVHHKSEWSATQVVELLCDLAQRGVLEVAYGGGEPFMFKAFEQVLEQVATQSLMVQNITTNGVLMTAQRAQRIAAWVGQVRVSVYEAQSWVLAVQHLVNAGIQTGLNIMVEPAGLALLPSLLAMAQELGCHDVAVLRYVGPDALLHLSAQQQATLASIVRQAPLPVKLSVCFGQGVDLPLLHEGDCGAGDSFVSITSERRLRACSFHSDVQEQIHHADDVIRLWRAQRAYLMQPSVRRGCARSMSPADDHAPRSTKSHGLRIWQGFSGNNSGECVHVARFESIQKATDAMQLLGDGYAPGGPYSQALQDLLTQLAIPLRMRVEPEDKLLQTPRRVEYLSSYPQELVQVGPVVMATYDSALDDVFPEIRSLLNKQGATTTYASVHEHDNIVIVAAFHSGRHDRLLALQAELQAAQATEPSFVAATALQGSTLRLLAQRGSSLSERAIWLQTLAVRHQAEFAMELAPLASLDAAPAHFKAAALADAPAARAQRKNASQGLFVYFPDAEHAQKFGRAVQDAAVFGEFAWLQAPHIGPRMGYIAGRYRGLAHWISADFEVTVTWRLPITGYQRKAPLLSDAHCAALLQLCRPHVGSAKLEIKPCYVGAYVTVVTPEPRALLQAGFEGAQAHGLNCGLWVSSPQHMAQTLERVRIFAQKSQVQ